MILVDTSVWVDHFRKVDVRLQILLSDGKVLAHPAVIGELACGTLSRRSEVLSDLWRLPSAKVATAEETLFVIESRRLWGKGIGWTDAQLIAAALLSECQFWTMDRRLHGVAGALHIAVKL